MKMRSLSKYYFSLLSLLAVVFNICSCSDMQLKDNDIEKLIIYSIPRNIELCSGIHDPEYIIRMNDLSPSQASFICRDTTLSSSEDIARFARCMNQSKYIRECTSIDIRTVAVLYYSDGEKEYVSFDNTGCLWFRDKIYESNPMFTFLNEKVYSIHDESYWHGDFLKMVLSQPITPDRP